MSLADVLQNSNAWPVVEARAIAARLADKGDKVALFETGYGPSGLPHIGTFGEVARTAMVMHAYRLLTGKKAKLIAVSDDMDGLRKIPDNVPNKEMLKEFLGRPLTKIPDPFGEHDSFGAYMNNKLCSFLDKFGFEYEFRSSSEYYRKGEYDEGLRLILQHHQEICDIILPTLGDERRETYSPFLPVCPHSGHVLQAKVLEYHVNEGKITYEHPNGEKITTEVTGGKCKLQWKVDWPMRWVVFGVDFEMHGKDLIPSAEIGQKICRVLGRGSPINFCYELFLDEKGQKISKSKGNGISMDDWLRYAPTESLALYMYQSPKKAKKLYFDVIPKQMDEYLTYQEKYHKAENDEARVNNPLWHIHQQEVPASEKHGLNFSLLLNLASVCNPESKEVMWGFIRHYSPNITPANSPLLDRMVDYAIRYYYDFVAPNKNYRAPTQEESKLLEKLIEHLRKLPNIATSEEVQQSLYDFGREENITDLRAFFQSMYEILLGQTQGPRFGTFIALFGLEDTVKRIEQVLHGNKLN